MRIIIVGAGEVGTYLGEILSTQKHELTIIEQSDVKARHIEEELNVVVLRGNGASCQLLVDANVSECDYFLAMTSDDRTNILSCSLAKALGATYTIGRIHDQTYSDNSIVNYQHHFGIDFLLNPEALCAMALAKSLRNPYRVVVENFARGKIEVQQVKVARRSKVAGKSVLDLKLDPRVRIGYVMHDGVSKVVSKDTVIHADDVVTLFGEPEVLFDIKSKFDPNQAAESIRVVLFGGTEIAVSLIRHLRNPRFKIRVLEKDEQHSYKLAEQFPNATIINGDGSSLKLLEEEQIGECDYFIACTKTDEINIMTALQASKLGAKHVQVVINKPDYENVLDSLQSALGVEMIVSPRLATAQEVIRSISSDFYLILGSLPNEVGKIIEVRIPHHNENIGKMVRELPLPKESVIVAQLHKFQVQVPKADDKVLADDRLIIVVQEDQINEVIDVFS